MEWTSRFERSHTTDRVLTLPRPRWRGKSHLIAAVLAIPAALWLAWTAPSGTARIAAAVFGIGMGSMFTASAVAHLKRWEPVTTEILFRLDHSAIYLAIVGTATPVALLALHGWMRTALLALVLVAGGLGILIEWLPFRTPRGVSHTLYLVLGWATVPMIPWIYRNAGLSTVVLLLAGGVAYTVGAVIVAIQRPDPNPHVFGYHEIWHLLVIAGAALHYVMVGATLLPSS